MRLTKSGICMTLGHIWEKKTKYVTTWLCSSQKKSWWFTLSFAFIWGLECTTWSLVGLQAGHLIQHLFCPLSFCLQKQSSDYIQLFCILLLVIFYQFLILLSEGWDIHIVRTTISVSKRLPFQFLKDCSHKPLSSAFLLPGGLMSGDLTWESILTPQKQTSEKNAVTKLVP